MPNYVSGPANYTAIGTGDTIALFAAETPAAPQASIAVAVAGWDSARFGVTLQADWATAPTASLQLQASNDGTNWVEVGAALTANGYVTDTNAFAFYRAYLASQSAGGAVTAILSYR